METHVTGVLSWIVTALAVPWVWRTVLRGMHSRADALAIHHREPVLHRDLLLRIYPVTGLMTLYGLFAVCQFAFSHVHATLCAVP